MITQIEIDGFKTFKNFKVELAPFQVIVGANGSGKSNLFDALQLLGRLATSNLLEAFQGLRGKAGELFTRVSEQQNSQNMRFAVEMLLDRYMHDDAGRKVDLHYTRLRYEIEITHSMNALGPDQLYVNHESLNVISRENDVWLKKQQIPPEWLPEADDNAVFIKTGEHVASIDGQDSLPMAEPIITTYREDQSQGNTLQYRARDLPRTVLSLLMGTEYLPISAVRQEMRSWTFLHLNPEKLRKPSPVQAPRFLSQYGENLPTMLAHMQFEDEFALTDVSRDMASLVADIYKVKVERNAARDEYDIWVETSDHRTFSSTLLSDGTLRLLALAAIKNDPQFRGVLCLEEPENSMHPLHMHRMARLLRNLATDFSDVEQKDEPLRQLLITTHSPVFIGFPEIIDSLLLAFMPLQTGDNQTTPLYVTRMIPVISSQESIQSETYGDKAVDVYTIDTVRQYLNVGEMRKADKRLKEARLSLIEAEDEK